MQEPSYPVKVFVYGTLKRGGSNHDVMADAKGVFICEAKTKELRILIVQGLPYLCEGFDENGHHVEGEIFEIPGAEGLAHVDRLEGNGTFYRRRIDAFVECSGGDDEPREHFAWVYYIIQSKDGEPQVRFELKG